MSDQDNLDPQNPVDIPSDEPPTPEVDEVIPPTPDETPPTPEKIVLVPNGIPPVPVDGPNPSELEETLLRAAEEAEAARLAAEEARTKRIEELRAERVKIEAVAQALTDEINSKETSADEFADWVHRHRRTFLWKMYSKMKEQLLAVHAKQNFYVEIMSNIVIPEPGELVRLRKRFHRTLLTIIGVGAAIWLVYYLITTFLPFGWVVKLTSIGGTILQYALSAGFVAILSAFMLYYKDWRKFDWDIKVLNHQLDDVAVGVDKVRNEEVKLTSLYPQVKDWLEIIGYSLNRPWSMNDRWFRSYLSDLNQDEFPFSLRIAQAQEGDLSSMNLLRGKTMKRFATQGWRTRVFKDQIQAIAQKVGLPLERMNIEGLDQDIAYSPGGPRSEMRKGLENPDALELVARKQLGPLTVKVQSEEITKSRPSVKENRSNALDEIQADQAGLVEAKRLDWDEFLKEPLGSGEGIITPFSLASLAPGQILEGYHERIKSHYVVPKRLEANVKSIPGARVESYLESANLPMDIVIRMDLSDAFPPNALKINPKAGKVIDGGGGVGGDDDED
jgi:hypothetical protein